MATTTTFLFLLLLFLHFQQTPAQENTTGYTCDPSQPTYPCKSYVLYTATAPDFLDLAQIGDLFGLSRLAISAPNNISSPNTTLSPGQPLYIPLPCSCPPSLNLSFSPLNFAIRPGDTFYLISTLPFHNLTTYPSVELVNPSLIPTNLTVGATATVPVFCLCPNSSSSSSSSASFILTYVLQPSDTLSSLSSLFLLTPSSILQFNSLTSLPSPYTTLFIPLSQLPPLPFSPVTPPPAQSPPPPPTGGSGDRRGEVAGLAAGLGVCGAGLLVVCLVWGLRGRRGKGVEGGGGIEEEVFCGVGEEGEKKKEKDLLMGVEGCLDKYRVFEMEELIVATEGFNERFVVDGCVYRGCIDGQIYAIKRMKWNACEELRILQKINHGNLVKLEGFSVDPEDSTCYLIYEYIENGSLHSHLHSKNNNNNRSKHPTLTWKTRLRIAIDVANGLQYIHEHTRPRVVHKDIKSSNILLDSSMRAKIANFGLAKSGCNAMTTNIVGTQGYIAPEFLADGVVTTKMDVFAFGVILLEMISGEEAMDEKGRALWTRAEGIWEEREKKVKELMDEGMFAEELGSAVAEESVLSVMGVAVSCVDKDPTKRMNMVDIVYTLSKNEDLFCYFSEDTSSSSSGLPPATAR